MIAFAFHSISCFYLGWTCAKIFIKFRRQYIVNFNLTDIMNIYVCPFLKNRKPYHNLFQPNNIPWNKSLLEGNNDVNFMLLPPITLNCHKMAVGTPSTDSTEYCWWHFERYDRGRPSRSISMEPAVEMSYSVPNGNVKG